MTFGFGSSEQVVLRLVFRAHPADLEQLRVLSLMRWTTLFSASFLEVAHFNC